MRQNVMNRRNRNNATRCAGVLDDHMDVYLRAVMSREGLDETATRHLRYIVFRDIVSQLRDLISDRESKVLYEYSL